MELHTPRMKGLVRFWFTFEESVRRGAYLRHGAGLMVLKYGGDAAMVALATRTLWTPVDYLQSVPLLLSSRLSEAAPLLAPALVVWTLPFLWVGVSMTMRRLLDAGQSAWWSLLFFVPVARYLLVGVLCLLPTTGSTSAPRGAVPPGHRLPSALMSMAVGALLGLGTLWLAVVWINSYGLALFMGTPFGIGVVTAFLFCRAYPASMRETQEVVAMTVLLVGGTAFAIGFEGAVCLAMVAPLGLVVAAMGAAIGRELADRGERPARGVMLIALLLPSGLALEQDTSTASLREVRSSIVVNAPPEAVWEGVIAFSPIPEPTSLLFSLGLAYPVRAEISGEGVGAVRYCVFSTGAFVEPITRWEPSRRLSFDVVESPRPLDELTPWDVAPPHLEGYLLARRGEFRLLDLGGGRTRLEGSTWYEQRLRPEGYWVVFSDYVIGRIHDRVLEHIKEQVEQ